MAFREDSEALLARAEALERDLADARRDLEQLRAARVAARPGESAAPGGRESADAGEVRWKRVASSLGTREPPVTYQPGRGAAALAEFLSGEDDELRLGIRSVSDFEDAIVRALDIAMAHMVARHRGTPGDGTHAQLVGIVEFLVALWKEHTAGRLPRASQRTWEPVAAVTAGWHQSNELGQVLEEIGRYYLFLQGGV